MTAKDIAYWLEEKHPSLEFSAKKPGGNIFIGALPKGVLPFVCLNITDRGQRYSSFGGKAFSSYEVYQSDITASAGENACETYDLGQNLLASMMDIKGYSTKKSIVTGCKIKTPISVKAAADGNYIASFSVKLTAADLDG